MQHFEAMVHRGRFVLVVIAVVGISLVVFIMQSQRSAATSASQNQLVETDLEPNDLFADPIPTAQPEPTPTPGTVVYITGAVPFPDAYTVAPDARIKDVIIVAGGFSEDADREQINLALRVRDQEHIKVPRRGETLPTPEGNAASTTAQNTSGQININTARADELMQLQGIGPALAQRIIDYRTTNGTFASIDELRKVKGIGSTLFDSIAEHITVGP